jgi:hypothetical protein
MILERRPSIVADLWRDSRMLRAKAAANRSGCPQYARKNLGIDVRAGQHDAGGTATHQIPLAQQRREGRRAGTLSNVVRVLVHRPHGRLDLVVCDFHDTLGAGANGCEGFRVRSAARDTVGDSGRDFV